MGLYGRQGRIIARPGQRDALAAILLGSIDAQSMPGCRLYLLGASDTDTDAVLVTEAWESEADHKASLSLPGVRDAIARARQLIERVEGEAMVVLAGIPANGSGRP